MGRASACPCGTPLRVPVGGGERDPAPTAHGARQYAAPRFFRAERECGMTHRAGGIYRILERPGVYTRFQSLLGGPAARRRFIDEFVGPPERANVLEVGCGTGVLEKEADGT